MPNRILKETVCTSENIESLSAEAERFFYRLMVQCDDYGRMDARLPVLRARCFPLKLDVVSDDHIRAWLDELVRNDLIRLYTGDDGRPYLYFVTWEKHQQIRAKKSKYPAPKAPESKEDSLISNDINGNHLQSNVPENPIQSNTNTTLKSSDDVFVVYEHEIGILTPGISDEIKLAEQDYPEGWVVEAIRTAAKANKRSWNYANGILRNWQAGGKGAPPPKSGKAREPTLQTIIMPDGSLREAMV